MEWGTPDEWGWFLLFSRSGRHKTKETYPTRPGSPTPCKQGLRLPSMKTRRIQDILLTINNGISDKALPAVRDLITLRSSKYNPRHDYILSLPKVNTTK